MTRPLVLTADPDLLDDLLRLAASSGVEVEVAHDVGAAGPSWATAPVVVVGADLLDALTRSRLGRRPRLVLLGQAREDSDLWQRAVQVGAEHVVFLPEAETWLADTLADAAEARATEGVVVGVVGGRGGAGATTLACALAVCAVRRDRAALLVDADPLGGGIDLVFGGEHTSGLRWSQLRGTRGRVPAQALVEALPSLGGLAVLSWDRGEDAPLAPEASLAVLAAARRRWDLVVVDLPRYPDAAARQVLDSATTVLLVVPAELRAAAAAAQVLHRLGPVGDLRLVVRGPAPAGLTAEEVARGLGLPLYADLRAEHGVGRRLEHGRAPGSRARSPLGALGDRLLGDLLPDRFQQAA